MAKRRTRVPFYGKAEQRHRQAAKTYAAAGNHQMAKVHHTAEVTGWAQKISIRGGRPDIAQGILREAGLISK